MRRTTRRLLAVPAVAGMVLTAAACGSDSDDATSAASSVASQTQSASESATMESSSPSMSASASKDIVATAAGAGNFKTLTTALTASGLNTTLKGAGPFTVFAPTDTAFAALPAGTLDTLLKNPKGDLATILKYHVVPGKVMAADVLKMNGKKVKTVQGAELTVKVNGSDVMLTDVTGKSYKVSTPDIAATNGVIHAIDGVLMPKK